MKKRKKFQDLDLSNAFLFAVAMEDPEICRAVLERILEIPIKRVIPHTEKTISANPETRSVRLDVFANDVENRMFNVEMQTANHGNLPLRSRFHMAQMDVYSLESGSDFNDLRESYIIFLCTFDPFGEGKYRYQFETICKETGKPLGDKTHRIFLNSKGKDTKDVPESLIQFLKYVVNSTDAIAKESEDKLVHSLHERISEVKQNGERRFQYMTLGEFMDATIQEEVAEQVAEQVAAQVAEQVAKQLAEQVAEQVAAQLAESEKKTASRILTLTALMARDGLADQIPQLGEDGAFLDKMLKQYGL